MTPSPADIIAAVATARHVPERVMRGRLRDHHIVSARHECFVRLRDELGLSYPAIGRLMARDHSTVMYGIRRWRAGYPVKNVKRHSRWAPAREATNGEG